MRTDRAKESPSWWPAISYETLTGTLGASLIMVGCSSSPPAGQTASSGASVSGSSGSSGSPMGSGPGLPDSSTASLGSGLSSGASAGGSPTTSQDDGGVAAVDARDSGSAGQTGDGGDAMLESGGPAVPGSPVRVIDAGTACGATATWGNPAKGSTYVHDPSLTKQGNTYYAFGTGKGLPFITSHDLVTWSVGGVVFSTLPAWTSKNIAAPETWAPDLHLVNGTYYVYYSVSAWNNFNSSVGLATNTTLDGSAPWVDTGPVVDFATGGTGVNVIDPDLFVDADGSWWLVYGSYKAGLRLVQLDPSTGKALTSPPNPTVLTKGLGEGSDIIKHDGYYYLFASRGTCCAGLQSTYQVVMGRAKDVHGPYLGKNGEQLLNGNYTVFLTGDATHPGTGGQSFFKEDSGQVYMVYHAYTAPSGTAVINVRPMWFDMNGWPTLDPCLAYTF